MRQDSLSASLILSHIRVTAYCSPYYLFASNKCFFYICFLLYKIDKRNSQVIHNISDIFNNTKFNIQRNVNLSKPFPRKYRNLCNNCSFYLKEITLLISLTLKHNSIYKIREEKCDLFS